MPDGLRRSGCRRRGCRMDGSAHSPQEDARLPQSGGATGSGGDPPLSSTSMVGTSLPESGMDSGLPNGGDKGMAETEELEVMSDASFETAVSQGHRTEDEEDTHDLQCFNDTVGMAE